MERIFKNGLPVCLLLLAAVFPVCLRAQNYHPVDDGSSITISIKNFGMATEAKLSGLEGSILFSSADLKSSSFAVSVDARTITTGIDVRDKNLQAAAYLNTDQYPRIGFVSRQILHGTKPGEYLVKGIVTLKGIAKEISIPFTIIAKEEGLLFTGECRVYRHDFKIAESSTVLSDNITVSLKVFAKKS